MRYEATCRTFGMWHGALWRDCEQQCVCMLSRCAERSMQVGAVSLCCMQLVCTGSTQMLGSLAVAWLGRAQLYQESRMPVNEEGRRPGLKQLLYHTGCMYDKEMYDIADRVCSSCCVC
jgi:hypothetical protein